MKKAMLAEFFDDTKLTHIECTDVESGKHIFDVLWDPRELNTPENREKFRNWVVRLLAGKDYTIE
jgi:hypothetical protein